MMGDCPHCGAQLEARLVAAIRDPQREESCPSKGTRRAIKADLPSERIGAYMLAAAIIRDTNPEAWAAISA